MQPLSMDITASAAAAAATRTMFNLFNDNPKSRLKLQALPPKSTGHSCCFCSLPSPSGVLSGSAAAAAAAEARTWSPKSLTTTTAYCSLLPGQATPTSTSESSRVGAYDPSLELKKRAADISSELKGTSIFLVGVKSSVKTSLGKLLADTLRYYYFDSDGLVEESAGGEVAAKSFRQSDEDGFRACETEVLKQLSSMGRLVVCAGNGSVQSATNLALLRHGISLWIDVPLEIVARGVSEGQFSSPEVSSGSDPEVLTELIAIYEEMRGGYATADAMISLQKVAGKLGYDEMDCVTIEDMALEALKEIEKLTRVKKMMEAAARPF